MGECDKDTTFEILDFFYDQGGNFIDTCVMTSLKIFFLGEKC